MADLPIYSPADIAKRLGERAEPYTGDYFAMYSSVLGGIVTDPAWMLVPADDHVVHRGDGVFETIKCVSGRVYCLARHIERLARGASRIGIDNPWSAAEMSSIVAQTIRAGKRRDCLVRMILARGPGGFGVNPYECPRPSLYVAVYALKPSFMEQHPGGARVRTSAVPVKPGYFATIKSCNYLPNVLMKKEAVDAGVDFSLSFDERDHLAEGATENAGVVTEDAVFRVPGSDRILPGTTMLRCVELAAALIDRKLLKKIEHGPISRRDLLEASEVLIFGTTPDVTAVVELDGKPVGGGKPGPVFAALYKLLTTEIHSDTPLHMGVLPK